MSRHVWRNTEHSYHFNWNKNTLTCTVCERYISQKNDNLYHSHFDEKDEILYVWDKKRMLCYGMFVLANLCFYIKFILVIFKKTICMHEHLLTFLLINVFVLPLPLVRTMYTWLGNKIKSITYCLRQSVESSSWKEVQIFKLNFGLIKRRLTSKNFEISLTNDKGKARKK